MIWRGSLVARRLTVAAKMYCVSVVLGGVAWSSPITFQPGDIVAGTGNGIYKVFDPSGNLLGSLNTTTGASWSQIQIALCFWAPTAV
jgi:hypothetical protein